MRNWSISWFHEFFVDCSEPNTPCVLLSTWQGLVLVVDFDTALDDFSTEPSLEQTGCFLSLVFVGLYLFSGIMFGDWSTESTLEKIAAYGKASWSQHVFVEYVTCEHEILKPLKSAAPHNSCHIDREGYKWC